MTRITSLKMTLAVLVSMIFISSMASRAQSQESDETAKAPTEQPADSSAAKPATDISDKTTPADASAAGEPTTPVKSKPQPKSQATKIEKKAKPTKTETKRAKPEPKIIMYKGAKMNTTHVVVETSLGNFELKLNRETSPLSVENFLKYIDQKHYDGTIFHRVIKGFMIQGGGMNAEMKEKSTNPPIKNEAATGGLNKRGTVAMARTNVVDSATAQFFVNTVDNGFLDHKDKSDRGYGYAVFAEVSSGMDTVEKIEKVPTGNKGPHGDVPSSPVTILTIKRK
jgi:cyclophilin family peptidyl-prolyl cis-trans isomerase